MTTLRITHNGTAYALTDEHAASSYGIPVLVDVAGTPHAAGDYVDALTTARDVATTGEHTAADGFAFRAPAPADNFGPGGYMELTDYGHATATMFRRFVA
jgi:hypothetical protein